MKQTEFNLEQIADNIIYTARKILSREGYLVPVIFLCTPKNEIYTVMLTFKDRREKYAMFASIKQLCKINKVIGFVFITEAWAASTDTDKFDPKIDKLPSERADKKEIVLVNAGYISGGGFTWFFDIKEKHGIKTMGSKQKAGNAINNLTAELLDYIALN